MLLGGGEQGGKRLLRRETIARMTTNQIGELKMAIGGHGDRFGYGFGVVTAEGKGKQVASPGSYSWGGIFHTYFWVDPKEELIGVLLTQVYPFGHLTLRQDFQRLVSEAVRGEGK
jgi:CubicO group peptidase (beta-lactamase class C family)